MAREPVTRMQLDAYRFSQRRLESALARRDPVLLHEELRGQRRVVLAGLALAMLALVGVYGYAKVANKPAWERQSIIAAKQSGRMFVVIHKPDRLVPVSNMVAARLVLAAAARSAGRSAPSGALEPTVLDDAVLDRAPRTPAVAVAGADGVRLPAGDAPVPVGAWAVCDVPLAGGEPAGESATAGGVPRGAGESASARPDGRPTLQTLVVVGAVSSPPLPDDQGLLVQSPDQELYLISRGRRYRLDSPYALQRAYDLVDVRARKVSAAVLTAIPEGPPLATPLVQDAGAPAPGGLPGAVGDILRAAGPGGERYYLVLGDGVAEVSRPVANLIRTGGRTDRAPALVPTEQVNAVPRVSVPELDAFPSVLPKVPGAGPGAAPDGSALCWEWGPDGRGGTVSLPARPPVPAGRTLTRLAQADGPGPGLDAVSVPTGVPMVVRAASGGGLWLVSDTGVGYRVAGGVGADNETASALGIQPDVPAPAPDQALRLLPAGPDLDLQSATRTVDVVVPSAPAP
jgi:hypothetical protein